MTPDGNAGYWFHLLIAALVLLNNVLNVLSAVKRRKTEEKRMAFYATMLDGHEAWDKFREYEQTIGAKRLPK